MTRAAKLVEKQLTRTPRGDVRSTTRNAYLLLRHDLAWEGVLALDEFALKVRKLKPPPYERGEAGDWTDTDTTRTQVWLEQRYEVEFSREKTFDAVGMAAHDNRYHPVRDYLAGIAWDGTPRCESWLLMALGVGARSMRQSHLAQYAARVGTMWLVSAIARVMEPGSKVDHVLILEGPQGTGKSSALSVLAGAWFLDTPFALGDKDAYQQIAGSWIVELAELDSLNKAEATLAKAFFSRGTDRYRPPYGRTVVDVPRQCVFAGTTNLAEYLRDPTGARRFWPVACHWFEREWLVEHRDQLWAEAMVLYKAGTRWWPQPEDYALLHDQQSLRETVDPWEEILARELSEPDRELQERYYAAELLKLLDIEPARQQERAMTTRLGAIMHRLGWRKVQATSAAERRIARFYYQRPATQPPAREPGEDG